jgi:hypothetical protein
LDEKLREVQKVKEELLNQKMDEFRELTSRTRLSSQPQPYTGPLLGYGMSEPIPQAIHANVIETGRQDRTANNPDVICYNCETPGHYESRCWRCRVSPEIRADDIQRINASRSYYPNPNTNRRRPYQPRNDRYDPEPRYELDNNCRP